jgi:hypothetical protein
MLDYASGHMHSASPGLLDGKSFHGLFIEKGNTTGDPDTLIFKDGRFRSTACDQYGYGDAPYESIADGDSIRFDAETRSTRYGRLVWKGTVKGNELKCEVLMLQDGKAPVENSVTAKLVS